MMDVRSGLLVAGLGLIAGCAGPYAAPPEKPLSPAEMVLGQNAREQAESEAEADREPRLGHGVLFVRVILDSGQGYEIQAATDSIQLGDLLASCSVALTGPNLRGSQIQVTEKKDWLDEGKYFAVWADFYRVTEGDLTVRVVGYAPDNRALVAGEATASISAGMMTLMPVKVHYLSPTASASGTATQSTSP